MLKGALEINQTYVRLKLKGKAMVYLSLRSVFSILWFAQLAFYLVVMRNNKSFSVLSVLSCACNSHWWFVRLIFLK